MTNRDKYFRSLTNHSSNFITNWPIETGTYFRSLTNHSSKFITNWPIETGTSGPWPITVQTLFQLTNKNQGLQVPDQSQFKLYYQMTKRDRHFRSLTNHSSNFYYQLTNKRQVLQFPDQSQFTLYYQLTNRDRYFRSLTNHSSNFITNWPVETGTTSGPWPITVQTLLPTDQ